MKKIIFAAALLAIAGASSEAQAVGCFSGAVAGGVAGHYAHHHAVLGAIGGCVAGHELKKRQQAAAKAQAQKYPNEIVHAAPAPVPPAPAAQ